VSAREKEPKSAAGSLLELVMIVVVALGLALGIQKFLVKPYRIPSGSMIPTLKVGQRVLVNRIGHSFSKPSIGDVVVFHPPQGAGDGTCGVPRKARQPCPQSVPRKDKENFIKRVVAGPGDRIKVLDGHVVLNGKRQKEPFIRPCGGLGGCDLPEAITVPAGEYFMMGDNRGESDDSRFWGPVPNKWIIGGAFATYWPPGRIGLL
jgi:signal peptidase I